MVIRPCKLSLKKGRLHYHKQEFQFIAYMVFIYFLQVFIIIKNIISQSLYFYNIIKSYIFEKNAAYGNDNKLIYFFINIKKDAINYD